jgi:hypothetical protein
MTCLTEGITKLSPVLGHGHHLGLEELIEQGHVALDDRVLALEPIQMCVYLKSQKDNQT